MDDKRPPWPATPSFSTQHTTATPLQHYPTQARPLNPLPPILPTKREYTDEDWHTAKHPRLLRPVPPLKDYPDSPKRRYPLDDKIYTPRRTPSSADSFVLAADMGARAQSALDSAAGNVFETYSVGKSIVSSSKLYANQRRSNRQLPGGSDSTTAACYMIGGTPDNVLSQLLSRVSPWDPREERCKAVERVLKDKTRGAICALNGENPREARADNLAAVRICEVVADILVAYSSKKLLESRKELYDTAQRQEREIRQLREELETERRKRVEKESECWCRGQPQAQAPVATQPMGDLQSFERNKLVIRGVLTSSGHRSIDSDRGSLVETVDKDGAAKFDPH